MIWTTVCILKNEELSAIIMITLSNLHSSLKVEAVEYGDGTYHVKIAYRKFEREVPNSKLARVMNDIRAIQSTFLTMKGINHHVK